MAKTKDVMPEPASAVPDSKKRNAKAKVHYVDVSGGEVKFGTDTIDSIAKVEFRFTNGAVETLDLGRVPDNIALMGKVRGLQEVVRDTYSGEPTVAGAIEAASDMIGRLVEGEWYSARQGGGPRMAILLAALEEFYESKGRTYDEAEAKARYFGDGEVTLSDGRTVKKAELRASAIASGPVAVIYTRLLAEQAAKRAAEMAGKESTVAEADL